LFTQTKNLTWLGELGRTKVQYYLEGKDIK
jgi:hypothetical protein